MTQDLKEEMFPELKESKDERIRKNAIQIIHDSMSGIDVALPLSIYKECIAWLEKQGEQKTVDESEEDEKIRKALMEFLAGKRIISNDLEGINIDKTLAWLKKQGKQKSQSKPLLEVWKDIRFEVYQQASGNRHEPNYSDDSTEMFSLNDIDEIFEKVAEEQDKQKTVDKVEPKFKVGDWVLVCDKTPCQIKKVTDLPGNHFQYWNTDGTWFGDGTNAHLWTIQDAKDGDVLALNGKVFIYAHRKQLYSIVVTHCFIDSNGGFYFDGEFGYTEKEDSTHPATKEQRDLLFQKMKEVGYEWDAEKKELKKIG